MMEAKLDFLETSGFINEIIAATTVTEDKIMIEDNLRDFAKCAALFQQQPQTGLNLKRQLEQLGVIYFTVLTGLTALHMACPDPDTLSDTWTGGRLKQECRQQRDSLARIYTIFDDFYAGLVNEHPNLPLPHPSSLTQAYEHE